MEKEHKIKEEQQPVDNTQTQFDIPKVKAPARRISKIVKGGTVTDLIIDITLNEDKSFKFETPVINGKLCAVLLNVEKPLYQLTMYLKDYPEIILLDVINIKGQHYLPLRHQAINDEHETFRFSNEKWYLNDSIVIEILGEANSSAKVVLRYE